MAAPTNRFSGKVVLLAEDEPAVRKYVHTLLSRHGFSVIDARDGNEALALSRNHAGPIDLLLTDVKMPGLNGVALANRIRKERPDVKVLIMSAHTSGQLAELSKRTDFVEKPFLPETLLAKIDAVLAGEGTDPVEV